MGGAQGALRRRRKRRNEDILRAYVPVAKSLGLSEKEVKVLLGVFNKVDTDNSGKIDLMEFWERIDVIRTPFTERVFALFDSVSEDSHIDFGEFMLSLYKYCACGRQSLISFAFDLYDHDASGSIECDEVELLLKELWGDGYENMSNAQQIMTKIQRLACGPDGSIGRNVFCDFISKYPALLYPAHELQLRMQKKMGGVAFWKKTSKRRLEMFSNAEALDEFVKHAKETVRVSFRKTPKNDAALLYPKSELTKREKREERKRLASLSVSERARRRSAADAEPSLGLGPARGAGAGAGAGGGLPKLKTRSGRTVTVTTTKGGRVRGRSGSLPPPKTPVKRLAHVAIATKRMQRGRTSKRHNRRASADDASRGNGSAYKVKEGSGRRGRSMERGASSRRVRSKSGARQSARIKFARLTGA